MPGRSPSTFALIVVLASALASVSGTARAEGGFTSYVTPFPSTERHRVIVLGDSFGAGLAAALTEQLRNQRADVLNKAQPWAGLTRGDGTEWDKTIAALTPAEEFQIAVVVLGADDRQAIRGAKQRLDLGSPGWQEEYTRRVDVLLRVLKARKAAVYWVGLPIMRGEQSSQAAQTMNGIFLERVRLAGAKFIDTWDGFVDAEGTYTDAGTDITGATRLLRMNDGVHLTTTGSQKMASFVEREITRDLAIAQRERDVPLAGDEIEQKNVRDDTSGATGSRVTGTVKGRSGRDVAAANGAISLQPELGRPAETVTILRPAIPGAVLAGLRASQGDTENDPGHSLPADLLGGLTVLSSIATSADVRQRTSSQVPLTESPFFKLLIRGDGITSRPGRADDFRWPRDGSTLAAGP